jgi:hypothetical protein
MEISAFLQSGEVLFAERTGFVPHSSAEPLFTSPPPKSDESSVERSLLRKIRQQDFLCDSLRAAIDAALAAQQSKGEA